MSNYTTELRHICEHYAGLTPEEIMFADPGEIISAAREHVFDFQYPLYDPEHKEELETKILYHYYMREISAETPGLFKLFLGRTMREIMPYYNQLYYSADLQFNPLHDVDLTRTHSGLASGVSSNQRDRNGETTGTGSLQEQTEGSSTNTHNDSKEIDEAVDVTGEADGTGSTSNTRIDGREIDETVNVTGEADGTGSSTNTRVDAREIDETVDVTGEVDGTGTSSKTTHTETETDTTSHTTGEKDSTASYSDEDTNRNAFSATPESTINGVEGIGGNADQNVSADFWLTDYRKIHDYKHGDSSASEDTEGNETGHSESTGDQTETGNTTDHTDETRQTVTDRNESGSTTDNGSTTDHREETRQTVTDRNESGSTTDNGSTTDHREETRQTVTDRNETGTATDNGSTTGSRVEQTSNAGTSEDHETGSSNFQNSDDWTETLVGKQGSSSYSAMILEYRETILNIDMMIIEALEPCFMQIY